MTSTVSQRVALELGLPVATVLRIARTAPHRYKVYSVPKRSGAGMREIAQPAREVKALQRCLISTELSELPVHHSATAYKDGASIRDNAQRHVANNFLLKADFRDFFPSIREGDVSAHLAAHFPNRYSEQEIAFICRLLLWKPTPAGEMRVSIGAPSSPFISNTIMYSFDEIVSQYCVERGIRYSRYADDLTFSTSQGGLLTAVSEFLRGVLNRVEYPRLAMNERKTVFTSKKNYRSVTGLVLATQGYVSVGRDRKRLIRSMIHRFTLGRLNAQECQQLKGLVAFVEDVEPGFVRRMEAHYSTDTLNAIRRLTNRSS